MPHPKFTTLQSLWVLFLHSSRKC